MINLKTSQDIIYRANTIIDQMVEGGCYTPEQGEKFKNTVKEYVLRIKGDILEILINRSEPDQDGNVIETYIEL